MGKNTTREDVIELFDPVMRNRHSTEPPTGSAKRIFFWTLRISCLCPGHVNYSKCVPLRKLGSGANRVNPASARAWSVVTLRLSHPHSFHNTTFVRVYSVFE
ncbi:unnamed protein product [Caenorhabditis auriculariae]|uniref:Uncharacterized protein n=1 Tax=Caenorhabditis auriculariae TaxID=2777116 RepID=A0A8S1GV41_9PELO|nr:unnamed protein product [Caenorhabditis auriculariae]